MEQSKPLNIVISRGLERKVFPWFGSLELTTPSSSLRRQGSMRKFFSHWLLDSLKLSHLITKYQTLMTILWTPASAGVTAKELTHAT